MSLTTLSINSKLWTNEDEYQIREPISGDDGLIEVERNDENNVTVHFRHVLSEGAMLSAETDRAGAIALAEALRSAAEAD